MLRFLREDTAAGNCNLQCDGRAAAGVITTADWQWAIGVGVLTLGVFAFAGQAGAPARPAASTALVTAALVTALVASWAAARGRLAAAGTAGSRNAGPWRAVTTLALLGFVAASVAQVVALGIDSLAAACWPAWQAGVALAVLAASARRPRRAMLVWQVQALGAVLLAPGVA